MREVAKMYTFWYTFGIFFEIIQIEQGKPFPYPPC